AVSREQFMTSPPRWPVHLACAAAAHRAGDALSLGSAGEREGLWSAVVGHRFGTFVSSLGGAHESSKAVPYHRTPKARLALTGGGAVAKVPPAWVRRDSPGRPGQGLGKPPAVRFKTQGGRR